jgi:pimeloyl-ACP methyl ester carboxylesterase
VASDTAPPSSSQHRPPLAVDPSLTPGLQVGEPRLSTHEAKDGTRLVVRHWPGGEQRPLVLCDGLGCDGYVWRYVLERWVGERPIFHLQWRGHGQSEVPADLSSLRMEVMVEDLSSALLATGLKDVVLLGHSMGVPIALECFRHRGGLFQPRVQGMSLMCGMYEDPIRTWHGAPYPSLPRPLGNLLMGALFERVTGSVLRRWEQLHGSWEKLMQTEFAYRATVNGELNPALILERDFRPYLEHLGRMDMRVFAQLARAMRDHSARDVLPEIDVPTLVVGGARDKFAPPWIAEEMHARIPGSELLLLVEGSHCAPLEQPRLVERSLERLLLRVDG